MSFLSKSLSRQLADLARAIIKKRNELDELERKYKELQEACEHPNAVIVTNGAMDFMSCNECGKVFKS